MDTSPTTYYGGKPDMIVLCNFKRYFFNSIWTDNCPAHKCYNKFCNCWDPFVFIFVMLQCLGYLCCFQAAILSLIQKCTTGQYEPVAEDPSMNLQERQTSLPNSPEHKANQTTHNYKPIISYPVVPSTSRQDASNYLDDVQPCSSKSSDPYRVAWYTMF